MASLFLKNKHLLHRAGFGLTLANFNSLKKTATLEIWKQLLSQSKGKLSDLSIGNAVRENSNNTKSSPEEKRALAKKNRAMNMELNIRWFHEMVTTQAQLREKMAFFWHGHFATRIQNNTFNQDIIQIFRKNALGNFGDLLFEVSQSPAMLQFLNNQQNRKDHPNENFAREVLELFTMGRGNYSEKDIKEAARAFTGWTFDKDGSFVERKKNHDSGMKTFLGKTGNFDGNDILKIILENKQTARFITTKIYKFFVNEKINNQYISFLSDRFYQSNYNIEGLLTDIFTSDWFYEEENIGAKIKSPIELMVGIQRTLPMKIERTESLLNFQKLMGQVLLMPPNVAGWPQGKSWIDSSTLMLRLKLPQIWSGILPMDYEGKDDDDVDMGMKERTMKSTKIRHLKNAGGTIDWSKIENALQDENIFDILLQKQFSHSKEVIRQFSGQSMKSQIINTMSTPEYQLC